MSYSSELTPEEAVQRCQLVMAHAWMVRTFIKHGEEVEDFPELMGIVRAVFDLSLALESRVNSPTDYFKMLKKKLGRFRKAVDQFKKDSPLASTHTNFQQAVLSIETCLHDLEELHQLGQNGLANPKSSPV